MNPQQTVADRVPTGCRPLRVLGLAVVSHPLDPIANYLRHLCLSHCESLAQRSCREAVHNGRFGTCCPFPVIDSHLGI
jgi:hypothetical protein